MSEHHQYSTSMCRHPHVVCMMYRNRLDHPMDQKILELILGKEGISFLDWPSDIEWAQYEGEPQNP